MATDLTVALADRPGSLAHASDVLGRAGVNIEGVCGYVCLDDGVYHVLVKDHERARRALMDAGFELRAERAVTVVAIEDRPGAAAALFRRVADAGVNIDLVYPTVDGRLVLGGSDPVALERALG